MSGDQSYQDEGVAAAARFDQMRGAYLREYLGLERMVQTTLVLIVGPRDVQAFLHLVERTGMRHQVAVVRQQLEQLDLLSATARGVLKAVDKRTEERNRFAHRFLSLPIYSQGVDGGDPVFEGLHHRPGVELEPLPIAQFKAESEALVDTKLSYLHEVHWPLQEALRSSDGADDG